MNPKKRSLPVYASDDIRNQQILIWDKGVIKGLAYTVQQFFTNLVDNYHVRKHALNSSLDHSGDIIEGNIMVADSNGLPADGGVQISSISGNGNAGTPKYIPEGTTITVPQTNQYLVKNRLWIRGSIKLTGDAQLIVF
jgi:hypothetical protein